MDLRNGAPVAVLNGDEFKDLEGEDYIVSAANATKIEPKAIQNLYYHQMGGNDIKKCSVLAIPSVMEKGIILQPWRQGHNKKLKTGVMAAPITIGGTRYVCCVVISRNVSKKISPYAIQLFTAQQIEEMVGDNIVHDGANTTSQSSDATNSTPLSVAKILQKYLLGNRNEENNQPTNNQETNENKIMNKKQVIRLTESQFHQIVKETVKNVLRKGTLKESTDCYTMEDWKNDGTLNLEIGQEVDDEVLNQLINGVPPHYLHHGYFQAGEPYDSDRKTWEPLYMTFNGNTYIGLKPSMYKQFKQHA